MIASAILECFSPDLLGRHPPRLINQPCQLQVNIVKPSAASCTILVAVGNFLCTLTQSYYHASMRFQLTMLSDLAVTSWVLTYAYNTSRLRFLVRAEGNSPTSINSHFLHPETVRWYGHGQRYEKVAEITRSFGKIISKPSIITRNSHVTVPREVLLRQIPCKTSTRTVLH